MEVEVLEISKSPKKFIGVCMYTCAYVCVCVCVFGTFKDFRTKVLRDRLLFYDLPPAPKGKMDKFEILWTTIVTVCYPLINYLQDLLDTL